MTETSSRLSGKQVAFLVAAEGIEQVELTEPWKAVEEAGGSPKLVSPKPGKVQAFHHLDKADTFDVDIPVGDADPALLDRLRSAFGWPHEADLIPHLDDAGLAVLEDADPGRPVVADEFTLAGADDRDRDHEEAVAQLREVRGDGLGAGLEPLGRRKVLGLFHGHGSDHGASGQERRHGVQELPPLFRSGPLLGAGPADGMTLTRSNDPNVFSRVVKRYLTMPVTVPA